ncbi:ATP-binding cassette domain-containing protein [Actinoplanes sp. NEAU-A12]|uniref:ATP-binding cassette domain-containing protein n=1 Tax=Actinoplanes sandaracinus TaxID=3045177 RepID=A0ABT6WUN7_9ACTN|nr:ATP-binding cassette domain-containing protein [Actinoplanes sandaracinus]MDI6103458.1 ATP-binding cassette domain-containing protein [Actinoplanes sandaracinus]
MLEVRDLRKEFKGVVAVDGVSFRVAAGGSLAVVGESGSGKTTCARIVTGLTKATSGTVVLNGSVQMVFQDPYQSLDRRQTVRGCLAEVLAHHRKDRSRIGELLDLVGLDRALGEALPRHLSGGQRQRVAIARALAAEPRLLVLDEAVAALDVSIQAQILNLLVDARAATGVAYLFITHDLSVVRHVCEDVVVMSRGRVVEAGPVERVLHRPDHEYTRRLVASVPRPGWVPSRAVSRG